MKKKLLVIALAVLLVTPALLMAGGSSEKKESGPITLWSEVNIKSPKTNLDKYFAKAIAGINKALGRPLNIVTTPYNKIDAKLNLAVQANGEVPDVSQIKLSKLAFHIKNGSLMDITDYVKSAPWYKDISKTALKAGMGPDGKIYVVPFNTRSTLLYYYKKYYPDGPPKTTEELLAAAPALKAKGVFAITGKASEAQGVQVWWWSLIRTYGGHFADKNGKITWANPATVKAIEYTRKLVNNGYAPEVILAPKFDDEIPFMNGIAAAFNAGSWSYVWLNPLKAPSGKKYDFGPLSVEKAMEAGDLGLAPQLSAPGSKPVSALDGIAWGIPKGSKNVKGAEAFINYMMQAKVDADVAFAWGGVPTNMESQKDPRYSKDPYWKTVIKYMNKYSEPMEKIPNYDEAMLKFADTAIKLVQNPNLDIMSTLKKAQKEINAAQ